MFRLLDVWQLKTDLVAFCCHKINQPKFSSCCKIGDQKWASHVNYDSPTYSDDLHMFT
jgi:hypothetical protein